MKDFEELTAKATIAGDLTEALSSLADGGHDIVVEDGIRLRVTMKDGVPSRWRAFRGDTELSTLVILNPPTITSDADGGTDGGTGCETCGYVCAAHSDGGRICWRQCFPSEC
jgi:hypothetical protein